MRGERAGGQAGRRADGQMGRRSAGATLIELLVVLVILSLMAGISTVAVGSLRPPREASVMDTVRSLRARAIRTGRPITRVMDATPMRFLPDGRVLGGAVDPLTGAWPDAR